MIEALLSTTLTVGLTYLLYYVFKPSTGRAENLLPYNELRAKYYKLDVRSGFIFLFLWFSTIIAFGILCTQLNKWINSYDNETLFTVLMHPIAFFVVGILCCLYPTAVLVTRWIRKRVNWGEFLAYYHQTHKLDWIKMEQYLAKPLFILGLVILSLCFNTYTRFTSQNIDFNPFFGFRKTYNYSDVSTIHQFAFIKAPNGEVRKETSFQIQFKDGRLWNSRVNGYDSVLENKNLVNYVSQQANLAILKGDTTTAYP
jgi:hypothetical protein